MSKPFAVIIEDDRELGAIVSEILQTAGVETDVIVNGSLALKRLTELTPEMVILDILLPDMSGLDILRHIRSDPRLNPIKVVVITADTTGALAAEEDADLVLTKPVTYTQLLDLAEWLLT